jgi:hypothetical protein
MSFDNPVARVPTRYWGYLVLAAWALAVVMAVGRSPYGIDEGAAKALLLSWSIADQVASSVLTFSAPDLRAALFLPVGELFAGSVIAAKVFTAVLLALAMASLYLWSRRRWGDETAMLGTGILMISPAGLLQVDTLGGGTFLLLCVALGAMADRLYRASPRLFGGWFFAQLALCAVSVSLHPAGLAYPLTLAWGWWREPAERSHRNYIFGGIAVVTGVVLLAWLGWNDMSWLANPLRPLASAVLGATVAGNEAGADLWLGGGLALLAAVAVVVAQRRALLADTMGRSLLLCVVIGVVAADATWAFLVLVLTVYFGFAWLLERGEAGAPGGFLRQRGIALALIFVVSLVFMSGDKSHIVDTRKGELAAQDRLLQAVAEDIAKSRKAVADDRAAAQKLVLRVASEWPARTMLACRCDTLPLPPAARDPQSQLAMLGNVTHLVFDPKQIRNLGLADNMAGLGGSVETAALMPGGVMLHVRHAAAPVKTP